MCGIVAYVGDRPCKELILTGLERLEYRGYDSAGFALQSTGPDFEIVRSVGKLADLRAVSSAADPLATTGVGHTRWATHGRVTQANAHPHADGEGRIAVVMNGIIENYVALRAELIAEGVTFTSETDTEVLPHMIARAYQGDLAKAVADILPLIQGHYAFVAMHASEPGRLVGAREECPLVVGIGEGERFVASAIPAFLRETRQIQVVESGDLIVVEAGGVEISSRGTHVVRDVETVDFSEDAAEKGGFETFMLKEIHEQPEAIRNTIADRIRADGTIDLPQLGLDDAALARIERVHIVACGTSYHAGLVGRYLIEDWARVPVHVEVASEYRYRTCLAGPGDLAKSSGVPSKIKCPPLFPPSGPKSIIQSAHLIISKLCSITINVFPLLTKALNASNNFRMS